MTEIDVTLLAAPTIAPLGEAPRRVLERLHSAGIRAVQLSTTMPGLRPRDLDASGRRDLTATMRRHELIIAGLDLWIPVDHFHDPAQVDRAVEATLAAIELAGDLGRCPVSMQLPGAENESESSPGQNAEILQTIASKAIACGVAVADHAHPPTGHAAFGIGFDPAACIARGDDPLESVSQLGPRLVSARLCDLLRSGQRGPVGDQQDGQLDVMAYRVALSTHGYCRPIVVDARQWARPWEGIERTVLAWKSCAPG